MTRSDSTISTTYISEFFAILPQVFKTLGEIVAKVNTDKGWRDRVAPKPEQIALIHSEVSELLEWTRKGDNVPSDHIDASGEAEELADVVIRCLDYADLHGVDLGDAISKKLLFNVKRGYRHGGKKF